MLLSGSALTGPLPSPSVSSEPDIPGGHRLGRPQRLLKAVLPRRASVDRALDRLRLRIDSFPNRIYQPMPWLGIRRATRGEGTGRAGRPCGPSSSA